MKMYPIDLFFSFFNNRNGFFLNKTCWLEIGILWISSNVLFKTFKMTVWVNKWEKVGYTSIEMQNEMIITSMKYPSIFIRECNGKHIFTCISCSFYFWFFLLKNTSCFYRWSFFSFCQLSFSFEMYEIFTTRHLYYLNKHSNHKKNKNSFFRIKFVAFKKI